MSDRIYLGGGGNAQQDAQNLLLKQANRHGLIAGATGTGKTVTLQIMAEGFSEAGVPVFCADVKGDLSGIGKAGSETFKLHEAFMTRARKIGFADYSYQGFPAAFWDVFGAQGHAARTTIAEMGPTLLARLMDLNETQEGVLTVAFEYADDENLLLLDLKDLQALLVHLGHKEVRADVSRAYGNIAPASLSAIQRRLLQLEREGAELFFGEPALALSDLMRTADSGRGMVSILDATRLINSPDLYSTFLLWLLSELFEQLPEVGDPDKPKLVFFFDEAHLLFRDAPKALIEKVEQVVRLIRSKGVGVYFVTQNPRDLPDSILAQLGNRIQHALRAYTPNERKAVHAAAQSFRPNPAFDTEEVITQLGTGEALVSTLDEKSAPAMVQRTLIRPPSSQLGPLTEQDRSAIIGASALGPKYDAPADRGSAYEILQAKEQAAAAEAERLALQEDDARRELEQKKTRRRSSSRRQSVGEAAMKTAARTVARDIARYLLRGIMGTLKRRQR